MQTDIDQLRLENEHLKRSLAVLNGATASSAASSRDTVGPHVANPHMWEGGSHDLDSSQVTRYSRQILLRSFGAEGTYQQVLSWHSNEL